jgi:hypothetical protein
MIRFKVYEQSKEKLLTGKIRPDAGVIPLIPLTSKAEENGLDTSN